MLCKGFSSVGLSSVGIKEHNILLDFQSVTFCQQLYFETEEQGKER